MKRFPLLFPLVALVAGCLPARGDAMHLNYYNRRYCLYSNGSQTGLSYNNSVSPGMEPAVAFQRLMCHADARGEYHEWAYAQLDPAAPDPLVTALMLVDCVATGACGPVEVERNHGPSAARTSDSFRFARDIDPGAVQAALVGVEAPEEVKEAFLRRLDACRAHIVSSVAHMHPRLRAVYVDTIERTREDRRALLADLAPVAQSYEAVRPQMDDALLNGSFNVDVHERVRAIRDAAILTCTAQHHRSVAICANGPITHVLGEYLVRSAAGLERPDEAAAEQRLLNDVPNTTDERYALHLAVGEAMARETSMAREYAAASERLSSSAPAERERLLSGQFGDTPPLDLSRWTNAVGVAPPRAERLFNDSSVRPFEGRVVRVRRRGRAATLDVERTDARYANDRPSSFTVPWSEAEHLDAGHWVRLVTRGEDARVVLARAEGTAEGPIVQVRTAWLGE